MRINLKVPFAQKEAAKELGARWDAARKIWYVVDPESIEVFADWMPETEAASGATAFPAATAKPSASPKALRSPGVQTGPKHFQALCTCAVQPWEDCPHSAGASPAGSAH